MEHPDRLTAVEERSKSNTKRLDEMHEDIENIKKKQDDLESLTTSFAVMANDQEAMKSDVKEIKQDVKNLASIPAKRWESVIEKAISVAVGAIVTYLLAKNGIV